MNLIKTLIKPYFKLDDETTSFSLKYYINLIDSKQKLKTLIDSETYNELQEMEVRIFTNKGHFKDHQDLRKEGIKALEEKGLIYVMNVLVRYWIDHGLLNTSDNLSAEPSVEVILNNCDLGYAFFRKCHRKLRDHLKSKGLYKDEVVKFLRPIKNRLEDYLRASEDLIKEVGDTSSKRTLDVKLIARELKKTKLYTQDEIERGSYSILTNSRYMQVVSRYSPGYSSENSLSRIQIPDDVYIDIVTNYITKCYNGYSIIDTSNERLFDELYDRLKHFYETHEW